MQMTSFPEIIPGQHITPSTRALYPLFCNRVNLCQGEESSPLTIILPSPKNNPRITGTTCSSSQINPTSMNQLTCSCSCVSPWQVEKSSRMCGGSALESKVGWLNLRAVWALVCVCAMHCFWSTLASIGHVQVKVWASTFYGRQHLKALNSCGLRGLLPTAICAMEQGHESWTGDKSKCASPSKGASP